MTDVIEAPRSKLRGMRSLIRFTGLEWTRKAGVTSEPADWNSALEVVQAMNAEKLHGVGHWRLPNIRELESLVDTETHSPALPPNHPFENVREYYWSSTTSTYDPTYAWVLYMVEGAVGVGYKKHSDFFVWAVHS